MRVITALILVIMLMFSAPAFSQSKLGITYIALGDSIAVGTGATNDIGYTSLLNSHIERVFGKGYYFNLSTDGLTSSDMLTVLQTNYSVRYLISNADIYVNTVFNPFTFNATLFEFADPAIQGLNAAIWSSASTYGYKVVDVYSKLSSFNNPNKLIIGDLSTFPLLVDPLYTGTTPLHPTDLGYKFIFNMHKDLMN